MPIDIRAPLQTVSGERVTLFSASLKGLRPLGGWRTDANGDQHVEQWTADGFRDNARAPGPLDLENAPPSRGFVNIYVAEVFNTRTEADAAAKPERVARLAVRFTNGQLD